MYPYCIYMKEFLEFCQGYKGEGLNLGAMSLTNVEGHEVCEARQQGMQIPTPNIKANRKLPKLTVG